MREFIAVLKALFVAAREIVNGTFVEPPKESGHDDDEKEVTKVHDDQ